MIDDRKLEIIIQPCYHEQELSHWEASLKFDGEEAYVETGLDLRGVADKIYTHVWEKDSIIPDSYRYKMLDNPFTPDFIKAMEIANKRKEQSNDAK